MHVKAIIFDLDGTLVDTIEDIGNSANILFHRHGYPQHTTKEYIQWIGNGAKRFIEQGLGNKLDKDKLESYVDEFKEIYSTNLAVKSSLFTGIGHLLDLLHEKDIRLSILSNKPHRLTKKVVEHYLSGWTFDPVFGQREDVPRKPDPSAALEIAGLLEVKPEKVMFVGDSAGDIKTADAAGMIPVGVSWGYGNLDMAREKGYPVISDPLDLIDYF